MAHVVTGRMIFLLSNQQCQNEFYSQSVVVKTVSETKCEYVRVN